MYYIKCRKNRKYYEARLVFQPKGRDSQVETYLRKGNLIFQGYKGSGKSLIYNNFSKKKKYDFEKILSIDIQYTDTSDNYYTISFLVNMIKDITN